MTTPAATHAPSAGAGLSRCRPMPASTPSAVHASRHAASTPVHQAPGATSAVGRPTSTTTAPQRSAVLCRPPNPIAVARHPMSTTPAPAANTVLATKPPNATPSSASPAASADANALMSTMCTRAVPQSSTCAAESDEGAMRVASVATPASTPSSIRMQFNAPLAPVSPTRTLPSMAYAMASTVVATIPPAAQARTPKQRARPARPGAAATGRPPAACAPTGAGAAAALPVPALMAQAPSANRPKASIVGSRGADPRGVSRTSRDEGQRLVVSLAPLAPSGPSWRAWRRVSAPPASRSGPGIPGGNRTDPGPDRLARHRSRRDGPSLGRGYLPRRRSQGAKCVPAWGTIARAFRALSSHPTHPCLKGETNLHTATRMRPTTAPWTNMGCARVRKHIAAKHSGCPSRAPPPKRSGTGRSHCYGGGTPPCRSTRRRRERKCSSGAPKRVRACASSAC